MAKIDPQQIIEYVENEGYKFIRFTEGDKASNYRMDVICPENHEYNVKYKDFKSGRRCKKCFYLSGISGVRNSQEEVVNELNKFGYTPSKDFTYQNNRTKFDSTCENGHIRHECYFNIVNSPNCPECEWGRKSSRYSEDDINNLFLEFGLTYISGFKNAHEAVTFKCHCGNVDTGNIYTLKESKQCKECSNHKKYTLEELQEIFADEGCILLETKVDKVSRLQYQCNCGNKSHVSLYDFRHGVRCIECGTRRRSGENHPDWNPDLTDEERFTKRKYPEYKSWRLEVYERDNYTCQCCGDNKGHNLVAHHLDSHDWAIELRTLVENGVTLCDICHTDFHKLYGYGDNTREQFEEYMDELFDSAI